MLTFDETYCDRCKAWRLAVGVQMHRRDLWHLARLCLFFIAISISSLAACLAVPDEALAGTLLAGIGILVFVTLLCALAWSGDGDSERPLRCAVCGALARTRAEIEKAAKTAAKGDAAPRHARFIGAPDQLR